MHDIDWTAVGKAAATVVGSIVCGLVLAGIFITSKINDNLNGLNSGRLSGDGENDTPISGAYE